MQTRGDLGPYLCSSALRQYNAISSRIYPSRLMLIFNIIFFFMYNTFDIHSTAESDSGISASAEYSHTPGNAKIFRNRKIAAAAYDTGTTPAIFKNFGVMDSIPV